MWTAESQETYAVAALPTVSGGSRRKEGAAKCNGIALLQEVETKMDEEDAARIHEGVGSHAYPSSNDEDSP